MRYVMTKYLMAMYSQITQSIYIVSSFPFKIKEAAFLRICTSFIFFIFAHNHTIHKKNHPIYVLIDEVI